MRIYSSLEKTAIAELEEKFARWITDEYSLAEAKLKDRLRPYLQEVYREGARDGYSEALREIDHYGSPNALLRAARALVDSGLADRTISQFVVGETSRLFLAVGQNEYDALARLLKDIEG